MDKGKHDIMTQLYAAKEMIETYFERSRTQSLEAEAGTALQSEQVLKKTQEKINSAFSILKRLGQVSGAPQKRSVTNDRAQVWYEWRRALALTRMDENFDPIEVVDRIPSRFPEVRCHADDLKEIFYHLTRNAVQAICHRGKIAIRSQMMFSTAEEPYALITVSDTGCGIPEKNLSHMFKPFFTTKTQSEGNGLGLYIVRQLVMRNGGKITVSSFEGFGATFAIELRTC
jgi:signal transduction histidine kinase